MSFDSEVAAGTELLGYRLEQPVGRGGMGVVYRAYDRRLRRTVAVKLMAPELALDHRFRERFANESAVAMSLEHPHVVPIYDAGEVDDGRLYLAMRFVEGTDLRSLLRAEGPLAPARALAIATGVARALDAAHARGLVHRDVKPSNVLLDPGEHAYLADFGLTRAVDGPALRGDDLRSLGTPAYVAPEQLEGRPVDGRCDQYSLACLLYECLTGEPPFARRARLAVAWAHLEDEPPSASERNEHVPRAVDAVIRRGMAKDPDARFGSCCELVEAAREALGLAARSRRRRLVLTGGAVAAGAAVAFAAAVVALRPESARSLPVVEGNSVVRVDPRTNVIEAVVPLERAPIATAVRGGTVWTLASGAVYEVDGRSNRVRHTTPIGSIPLVDSNLTGPLVAVDEGGLWTVGYQPKGLRSVLTRVREGGAGRRDHALPGRLIAVAVGRRSVWVVSRVGAGAALLRVIPATGRIARTYRLPTLPLADGIAVGPTGVYVTQSQGGRLARIDPRSGRVEASNEVGSVSTPPVAGFGSLWVCATTPGSSIVRLDPGSLATTFQLHSIPAEGGRFAAGYGALWRHDVSTGAVIRFDPTTGRIAGTIRVTPGGSAGPGTPEPTSVAVGAGRVWVSVAA